LYKEIIKMPFYDKTFCASPNCKNDCGRRMTDKERKELTYLNSDRVSYDYFCGGKEEVCITNDYALEREKNGRL
jgi:hypothetical protein